MLRLLRILLLGPFAVAPLTSFAQTGDPTAACDRIARLTLPGVTALTAERVLTGSLAPTPTDKLTNIPSVCRVSITSSTAPGSIIHSEIWLPEAKWNGRLLGTGNGGAPAASLMVPWPMARAAAMPLPITTWVLRPTPTRRPPAPRRAPTSAILQPTR